MMDILSRPQCVNKSPQAVSDHNIMVPQLVMYRLLSSSDPLEPFTLYMLNLFRGNKNIHLHLMSLLHIDMTQVVGILP